MLVIRPSLVRCLLRSLIFSWVIFLLWVLSILCIFWVTILCQTRLVKIFSPSLWLVFSFSWQGLSYSRRFYFNEVQLINYFSHELCLWFAPKKSLPHLRSSSVQFSRSVVSDSLWPHELQHARPPCPSGQPPCPSPTPGVYPNSSSLSRWCHPTISSSVVSFSSCLLSFPASGSFQMSQFFASGCQNIGVSASASVLPMNIQDWSLLEWTGWISL